MLTGICFWTGLTPELSRAAARHWRWLNHSASAEAAKRARFERIVRPHQPGFACFSRKQALAMNSHACRATNLCQVRVGRRLTRPAKGLREPQGESQCRASGFGRNVQFRTAMVFHGCGLTPELSRAAARHWRWFNHSASAEAAKRARLERIVSSLPAVAFAR